MGHDPGYKQLDVGPEIVETLEEQILAYLHARREWYLKELDEYRKGKEKTDFDGKPPEEPVPATQFQAKRVAQIMLSRTDIVEKPYTLKEVEQLVRPGDPLNALSNDDKTRARVYIHMSEAYDTWLSVLRQRRKSIG